MTVDAPGALVHVVAWRLNGPDAAARAAQAEAIVAAFRRLPGRVPGLVGLDVGPNVVEAPDAWDVAAVMVFGNRAALDAYQTHPDHLAIKALVGPLRRERAQFDLLRPASPSATGDRPHGHG